MDEWVFPAVMGMLGIAYLGTVWKNHKLERENEELRVQVIVEEHEAESARREAQHYHGLYQRLTTGMDEQLRRELRKLLHDQPADPPPGPKITRMGRLRGSKGERA